MTPSTSIWGVEIVCLLITCRTHLGSLFHDMHACRYVAVCFDEVKVKEGIVYDKHDCRVVGFVDFGEVNNALAEFERSLAGSSPVLAKQMLVFMVRGVFFRLSFPYAQFATRDLTADTLFPMVL